MNSNFQDIVKAVRKKYGQGSVMDFNENFNDIPKISTGNVMLDSIIGSGLPKGRIIEIYGPESSGKTTVSLHMLKQIQKDGGNIAFIDAEHAFDPVYASAIGLDVTRLLFSQPSNGEEAMDITCMLLESGKIQGIVVDSVAALVPKAELEGEISDAHVGLQARLMAKSLRKITAVCNHTGSIVIFINQIREKIGVIFGSPETTPGGRALKFFSSLRIDIRKAGNISKGNEIVGNKVRVKVVKNKTAPPYKTAEFDLYYGKGICAVSSMMDFALEKKIIERAGSWYSFEGEKIAQGRESTIEYISGNEAIYEKIRQNIAGIVSTV